MKISDFHDIVACMQSSIINISKFNHPKRTPAPLSTNTSCQKKKMK